MPNSDNKLQSSFSAELQEFIKLNHEFIEKLLVRIDKCESAIKQCEELSRYAFKISVIAAKRVLILERKLAESGIEIPHEELDDSKLIDKAEDNKKKRYVN